MITLAGMHLGTNCASPLGWANILARLEVYVLGFTDQQKPQKTGNPDLAFNCV